MAKRNDPRGRLLAILCCTLCLLLPVVVASDAASAQADQSDQRDQPTAEAAPSTQVTGGVDVGEGEFPFLASILFREGNELFFGCGGTLIAPEWVLSARHCFDNVNNGVFVGLGSRDVNTPLQQIAVAEIVRHPGGRVIDLALLRLAEPADTAQATIALGTYATRPGIPGDGIVATVVGWGDTDPAAGGTALPIIAQKADIITEPCDNNVGNIVGLPESPRNNVCGWNSLNRDACFGDSGGPLIANINGTRTVVATVESGPADGTCGLSPYGVYHRVGRQHAWIQETIAAAEPAQCQGLSVTINMNLNGGNGAGTDGDDVILGTRFDDNIDAGAGNDTICAGGGNDIVSGGAGDDQIDGARGDDEITGGSGADRLRGQSGDDRLIGDADEDLLVGGPGADVLIAGAGNDILRGGAGDDTLRGGSGNDTLRGNGDDDELFGGGGADTVRGDSGNDIVNGQFGEDRLFGDGGNDIINGGPNDDVLLGGDGNDELIGGLGEDQCDPGAGADTTASCEP